MRPGPNKTGGKPIGIGLLRCASAQGRSARPVRSSGKQAVASTLARGRPHLPFATDGPSQGESCRRARPARDVSRRCCGDGARAPFCPVCAVGHLDRLARSVAFASFMRRILRPVGVQEDKVFFPRMASREAPRVQRVVLGARGAWRGIMKLRCFRYSQIAGTFQREPFLPRVTDRTGQAEFVL